MQVGLRVQGRGSRVGVFLHRGFQGDTDLASGSRPVFRVSGIASHLQLMGSLLPPLYY